MIVLIFHPMHQRIFSYWWVTDASRTHDLNLSLKPIRGGGASWARSHWSNAPTNYNRMTNLGMFRSLEIYNFKLKAQGLSLIWAQSSGCFFFFFFFTIKKKRRKALYSKCQTNTPFLLHASHMKHHLGNKQSDHVIWTIIKSARNAPIGIRYI